MTFQVAEFFAGIGLVRMALERCGLNVVFANDIDVTKYAMYSANFPSEDFVIADVRKIGGNDIPDVSIATASFPCTDLSLAGNRLGLAGEQSGLFWDFARIIEEMEHRKPRFLLLENVPSFATSNQGHDISNALRRLNSLGYWCDVIAVDARSFVPQSRQRLFILASDERLSGDEVQSEDPLRPAWVRKVYQQNPTLQLQALPLDGPTSRDTRLQQVVERIPASDPRWWNDERLGSFIRQLSSLNATRLSAMKSRDTLTWATAYRRTRHGSVVWEIRNDDVSGCLRTSRGGSSKQALVEAGQGVFRVRWMTSVEYARLQGASDYVLPQTVSENQVLFGFGDAVCVPAIEWVCRSYIIPVLRSEKTQLNDRRPLQVPMALNAV